MHNFEKLEVYQRALDFTDFVYEITKKFPREELFSLTNQFRRAAISIVLNVVEGSGRTSKEFAHFLNMARTSSLECIAILEISKRRKYIDSLQYQKSYEELEIISKMLIKLRNAVRKSTNY